MHAFGVHIESSTDWSGEGISIQCPDLFTRPNPVTHVKKCACPNTVKVTKIYRYVASWIFLKRKGGFLYKSIGTKEILYPYLLKIPTSLLAVILLTPYCQGVRWVISCPKYNALNRPICRVDGSVSKVLVGSLLEGERISSK